MAMQGYTKLFNSILASSIWSEPDHTRIVWITMLAMADKDGDVAAALPGLAALSRIDIARCKEAVAKLEAPDEFSRTSEFDGRRIEKIDGGWRILNYMKFKRLLSIEERREYLRTKQQEHRDRTKANQQSSTSGQRMSTPSTHSDSDSDSKANKEESKSKGASTTLFVEPELVPLKVWQDFEQMRKKIRKPMTDRGAELIRKELRKLQTQGGHDPVVCLEQSIRNCWQDVFPPREVSDGKAGPKSFEQQKREREDRALREVDESVGRVLQKVETSVPNSRNLQGTTRRLPPSS